MAQALTEQVPHKPDFDSEVLAPLQAVQAAQKAEQDRLDQIKLDEAAAEAARQAAYVAPVYVPYSAPVAVYGALTGQIGYALAFGNCVNEPGVNNPGFGDPISWPVTSFTPLIGATALFGYNHVGVVTGIWSNGDLEIRHQNFGGGQHRFSRSEFRGFR